MYGGSEEIKDKNGNKDKNAILGSILENGTNGTINVADSNDENKLNIGMFTDDINTKITNAGKIIAGKNSYGIYGKNITTTATSKIKTGDNGVGIFQAQKVRILH